MSHGEFTVEEFAHEVTVNYTAFAEGGIGHEPMGRRHATLAASARARGLVDDVEKATGDDPPRRASARLVVDLCSNYDAMIAGTLTQTAFEAAQSPIWASAKAACLDGRVCRMLRDRKDVNHVR